MDLPEVPVEWETMGRNGVDVVEHALRFHKSEEVRINRRNSAEHAREPGIDLPDRSRGQLCHMGKAAPVRIDLRIPMRLVVRLVPDHGGFDHEYLRIAGNAGRLPALAAPADGPAGYDTFSFSVWIFAPQSPITSTETEAGAISKRGQASEERPRM